MIAMGADAFEGLAVSQQNALQQAAADAIPAALDASPRRGRGSVTRPVQGGDAVDQGLG